MTAPETPLVPLVVPAAPVTPPVAPDLPADAPEAVTASPESAPDLAVGGLYSVFQNREVDVWAGTQPIAVPQFDYSADSRTVATPDLTAAAAEETNPSGLAKSANPKEN